MRRRIAVVAIVTGVGLAVTPFATSLFNRTSGTERTFDVMRPLVSPPGLALAHRNFGIVDAGGRQFAGEVVPALAKRLGMSGPEFDRFVAAQFPDVAVGLREIPGYLTFVGPTIDALDANRTNFKHADALPGLGLPISASPWLILALGAAVTAAGVAMLRTRGRAAPAALLGVGVLAVALPLAFSLPSRASDARAVGDVARAGLSQKGADTAERIVVVLDRLVTQVDRELVPVVAQRIGKPPASVGRLLAGSFPDTARFLARWPSISAGPTGKALADKQQSVVDDFAAADRTPVKTLPWLVIAPGILLTLLAGGLLLAPRMLQRSETSPAGWAEPTT